jgi:hypothetical protein
MSKSQPFGRFPSIAAAMKNAQRILKQYLNKGPIPKPDADDVADLLNNHPDKAEKIGPGVSHFCVKLTEFKHPGFVTVWPDGSEHPFSIKIALPGKLPSTESQQIDALREEAWKDGQSHAFPHESWPARPSRELMLAFIASEPSADFRIKKTGVGVTGLIDRELAQRWITYYRASQQ